MLRFMYAFYLHNDQLPTMQVLAEEFGWKSPNAAVECCTSLRNHGLLEFNGLGKHKFTEAGRALVETKAQPA